MRRIRALRQPCQKMSWRESPPLELDNATLNITNLFPSLAYSAPIKEFGVTVRVSENLLSLAVLLSSSGDENCIFRTVANDACLQVDGQKVLQYLINMILLSFASCRYVTAIADKTQHERPSMSSSLPSVSKQPNFSGSFICLSSILQRCSGSK